MKRSRAIWPEVILGIQLMSGEFQPRILHLGGSGTTAARYAVLLVAAIVPLLLVAARSTILLQVMRRGPLAPLTAYLAWVCTAAVWSIDPTHALQPALWIISVSLYSVWYMSVRGWPAFELTFARVGIAYVVVGAFAEQTNGLGGGRFQGLMLAATAMGRFGGLLMILGASVITRGPAHRALGLLACVAGLYAIVVSSTRTAAFAVLVVGGWALVRRLGRSAVLGVTILGVGVVMAFTFAASSGIVIVSRAPDGTDFVEERNGILVLQHTPGGDEYRTGTGRTDVWKAAVTAIADRPLFGWGTGSSDRLFQELAARGEVNWLAVNAHNTVLQITVELGAVGLALFVTVIWAYRRAARAAPSTVRSALVLFLVIGSLGESLFEIGRVPLLVFVAVLAAAANDAANRGPTRAMEREPLVAA